MKYNKQIVGILVLTTLVAPQVMFAAASGTPKVKPEIGQKLNKFCENLDSSLLNSESKFAAKETEREAKLIKRQAEVVAKRLENDQKVENQRAEALAKQEANFAKLLAKATTTDQRAAVNDFISSVKAAIGVRQAAVDAARSAYRTGADQIFASRKASFQEALNVRKSAVEAALASAKTSCANGTDPATVKSTLQAAIKNAHEVFKSKIESLKNPSESIKTLNEVRKKAIEKAQTDFKNTLEALKVTLKSKLGNK